MKHIKFYILTLGLFCMNCSSEPLPQQPSTYPVSILWNATGVGTAGFAVDYIDSTATNGVRIGGSPVLSGTNYSIPSALTNGTTITVWATNAAGISSWPNPTAVFNANIPTGASTLTVK